MMEKLAGPRVCTYQFPGRFRNALSKLKALSFGGLEHELAMAAPRITWGGRIIGVRSTMKIIVASDFDAAILDQARDRLRYFFHCRPSLLFEGKLTKEFGFSAVENPEYLLGPLYETLPRDIAVKSFVSDYMRRSLDYLQVSDKKMIEAGRVLLRFSAPEEAAKFIVHLMERNPKKTIRLLTYMKREINIREYPYRRYELRDLREEVNYLLPRPYLL